MGTEGEKPVKGEAVAEAKVEEPVKGEAVAEAKVEEPVKGEAVGESKVAEPVKGEAVAALKVEELLEAEVVGAEEEEPVEAQVLEGKEGEPAEQEQGEQGQAEYREVIPGVLVWGALFFTLWCVVGMVALGWQAWQVRRDGTRVEAKVVSLKETQKWVGRRQEWSYSPLYEVTKPDGSVSEFGTHETYSSKTGIEPGARVKLVLYEDKVLLDTFWSVYGMAIGAVGASLVMVLISWGLMSHRRSARAHNKAHGLG